MMDGWGTGYGGGPSIIGGILMMLFWVAIIVGIVVLVVWLTRQVSAGQSGGGAHAHGDQGGYHVETAIDIVNARYARSEIDKDEYEQKKKDLTA